MMLLTWIIVLLAGGLLTGAALYTYRRRRVRKPVIDDDDMEPGVAPLLIMPQTRHNGYGTVPPVPIRRPSTPRAVTNYIAPLSGAGVEETIQLWPGRLEPPDGAGDQEIRFVRTPGVNRFTFGRSAGPVESHIQLRAPTASRMHAYMIVENGRWRIGNMSSTNAVLVNGVAVEATDAERWLEDGDRIELGEVVFIFRER